MSLATPDRAAAPRSEPSLRRQVSYLILAETVEPLMIGISAEKLDLIFEAFQQIDSGTGRRYGGTGLGLSIAKSLSDLLGFGLEVESAVGTGTTFRLTLPESCLASDGDGEAQSTPSKVRKPRLPGVAK